MMAGIKEILRRRMGLEAASIGEATVESAIVIATPADGPSFGVAPTGKCT